MSQPVTHYYVAQKALSINAEDLLKNYGNYTGLGTFGPDLYYLTSQSEFADMIHKDNSFDAFCMMINHVKSNWAYDFDAAGKQLGFAIGFYAHVITDCVFHPYVYRRSNDLWCVPKPPEFDKCEWKHKSVEASIDHYIMEHIIHPSFRGINVDCGHDYLDTSLVTMLSETFGNLYGIPYNLIEDAYGKFCYAIPTLYHGQNILYRIGEVIDRFTTPMRTQINLDDLDELDLINSPWPPGGNSAFFQYNVIDLFNMAVKGVADIVPHIYGYISDSNATNCQSYLASTGMLYLDGNWNLDTGLPSSWNQHGPLFITDHTRFDIGIEVLLSNYSKLG